MRKGTRRLLRTGALAALGYAAWRAWQARRPETSSDVTWESAPFPFPPVPRPAAPLAPVAPAPPVAVTPTPIEPFTDPGADGSCPATHPVKAKLASGIYRVPGSGSYERTKPDRCYVNAEAAQADGLRPPKR